MQKHHYRTHCTIPRLWGAGPLAVYLIVASSFVLYALIDENHRRTAIYIILTGCILLNALMNERYTFFDGAVILYFVLFVCMWVNRNGGFQDVRFNVYDNRELSYRKLTLRGGLFVVTLGTYFIVVAITK